MDNLEERLQELAELHNDTIGAFFNMYYSKKIGMWVLRVSYDFVYKDKNLIHCVINAITDIKRNRTLVCDHIYTLLGN